MAYYTELVDASTTKREHRIVVKEGTALLLMNVLDSNNKVKTDVVVEFTDASGIKKLVNPLCDQPRENKTTRVFEGDGNIVLAWPEKKGMIKGLSLLLKVAAGNMCMVSYQVVKA